MKTSLNIEGFEVVLEGRVLKKARLRAEYYDIITDPVAFLDQAKSADMKADLFSFLENPAVARAQYKYHCEYDAIAILRIDSFDDWWTKQIKDKIRNMIRKAPKKGVEIRETAFDDNLVRGIKTIYDESPIRQGRKFIHYGKDFETIKRDHVTYLERSNFIGAYCGSELIGFIKLVHNQGYSSLMQIIAMMAHRDKAPVDALLGKAVEICAQRGVPILQYGSWSRRGLGEYKIHRGFQRLEVPRYFIPLTTMGAIAMKLNVHHSWSHYVPERVADWLTDKRNAWHAKVKK